MVKLQSQQLMLTSTGWKSYEVSNPKRFPSSVNGVKPTTAHVNLVSPGTLMPQIAIDKKTPHKSKSKIIKKSIQSSSSVKRLVKNNNSKQPS